MSEIYNSNYFVTGGGTGGHIYPALAVADMLTKEGNKIFYVGNKNNMEYELAVKKGYKFLHVGVSGMPRGFKNTIKLFLWMIKLVQAIITSVIYLRQHKPKAVFATGGYVSAPMVFACIFTRTPYMMHDCDAMPGLVTRKLSKNAKYVSLAFERAKNYIQNKNAVVTGNPIREDFKTVSKEDAVEKMGLDNNKKIVCIMGGSQGARTINNAAMDLIKELSLDYDIQIIFQTGRKNYDDVTNHLRQVYPNYLFQKNVMVQPYFNDMVSVLKASDIVISRAGSLSLSEICVSDVAPVLVPYPYAASNHQRANAKYMSDMGACIYIEDEDLDANVLKSTILELINNPVKMSYLRQNAANLAKYDATEEIVKILNGI